MLLVQRDGRLRGWPPDSHFSKRITTFTSCVRGSAVMSNLPSHPQAIAGGPGLVASQARHCRHLSQCQPRIPAPLSLAVRFPLEPLQTKRWRANRRSGKISRRQATHLQSLTIPCVKLQRRNPPRPDLSRTLLRLRASGRMPRKSPFPKRNPHKDGPKWVLQIKGLREYH